MLRKLIDIQYVRNDTLLGRGRFRVKGDVVEVQPAYSETAYRVSMFGDEVEQITHFDPRRRLRGTFGDSSDRNSAMSETPLRIDSGVIPCSSL